MLRIPVVSSNLRSVGYDPQTQTLEIEFRQNTVYQYYKVPETVFQELMNAPSHGKYFSKWIKKTYSYRRIM